MKKILLLLAVAMMALSMSAAPVDQMTAQHKAKQYLSQQISAGKMMASSAINPVLIKTEKGNKLNQPALYIFNTENSFIVVAGDDRAEEILMVGDRPLNDINNLAPGLQDMLMQYRNEISFLQEHPDLKVDPIVRPKPSLQAVTYGPLLSCNWDQEAPFNNQCKFTYNNRTYTCLTGCPATSAAQVMYFWKYPTTETGDVPSYTGTLNTSSSNNSAYNVSFTYDALTSTTFDWANMKDSYSSSTQVQKNAVATLMRYVGQAEKMDYGVGASGISSYDTQNIVNMFKRFGYDNSTTRLVRKTNLSYGTQIYTDAQWAAMIQEEMAAGRPIVFMAIDNSEGGHAFNIDGYRDSDNKYHCNFGWSGSGNAWCALNSFGYNLWGQTATFNQYQQMVIGIKPSGPVLPTPVLTVNPTSLSFTGTVGETVTKTFTVSATDLQGEVTLTLGGSNPSAYSISPATLTAAQAQAGATVTVSYTPTAAGIASATVTVASQNAESKTVSLSGTATTPHMITVNPTSLDFTTEVGTPVSKTFNLKGVNLTSYVLLTVTGNGFTINKSNITKAAANNGIDVTVTFNPSGAGNFTGEVTLTSSGVDDVVIPLTATATAPVREIVVNPTSLNMSVLVGETATQTFNVSGVNLNGNLTLTLSGGNGSFSVTPRTITAADAMAGNVPVTVTYYPSTYGTHTAVVTITGGGAPEATVTLNGTAALAKFQPVMLPAVEEYINLTQFRADWTDETPAANVTSYTLEVTRRAAPTMLTASETGNENNRTITGITDKFYTVENLAAEGTFQYRVKALYNDGTESDWSNIEVVTLFQNGPVYQPGDVNHDGFVNISDVSELINYILNDSGDLCLDCADFNQDGDVNITDVSEMINMILNAL